MPHQLVTQAIIADEYLAGVFLEDSLPGSIYRIAPITLTRDLGLPAAILSVIDWSDTQTLTSGTPTSAWHEFQMQIMLYHEKHTSVWSLTHNMWLVLKEIRDFVHNNKTLGYFGRETVSEFEDPDIREPERIYGSRSVWTGRIQYV